MSPDYSRYNLEELRCALASIDQQRYPERVASLNQHIEAKTRIEKSALNEHYRQLAKQLEKSRNEPVILHTVNMRNIKHVFAFICVFSSMCLAAMHSYYYSSAFSFFFSIFFLVLVILSAEKLFKTAELLVIDNALIKKYGKFQLFLRDKRFELAGAQEAFLQRVSRHTRGITVKLFVVKLRYGNKTTRKVIEVKDEACGNSLVATLNEALRVLHRHEKQ
ncbi:hypothetical protein PN836_013105 [Ningiella sp. W23]|uniref:hypothetical protein n=1 Tax=Ningiella sp. W23 TaxID=3023715 RepID=UPI0037564698